MPSSRVQKAEVADDIKDPDKSELRTYDNITLMSRNFTFKGRVMFKSIGEIAKSGQLKMHAEVEEESGKRVDLFTLGNNHKAKWARVQYNDCVEVTGLKMQKARTSAFSESPGKKQLPSSKGRCGKTLVGYQDAAFDIRKLEEEEHQEYPEDEMDESDLASLLSLEDGAFFDINIYIDKILARQTRPLGENRAVPCQEVAVRDAQQKNVWSISWQRA